MTGKHGAARFALPALGIAIIGAIVALGWWQFGQSPAMSMETKAPVVIAQGRAVYEQQCASCHGAKLEGQPDWRTRLPSGRLPAPPHDASGHTWHHPAQQLFGIVKHGVQAFAPAGYESDMPAYAGVLSDAEIWAVLAFIKSSWPDDVRRRHDAIERANRAQ